MKTKLLILAAFLAACNKGADPAKDYSDIKAVPKHNTPALTTNGILGPFTIQVDSPSPSPVINFVAETESQVRFKINPDPRVTEFKVQADAKPEGSVFAPTEDPSVWTLTWKPQRASLNSQQAINDKVTVSAQVLRTNDGSERLLHKWSSVTFSITVLRDYTQPQIVEFRGLPDTEILQVEEGKVVEFSMEVVDPSSSASQPPSLIPSICSTGNQEGELKKEDGRAYLVAEDPTSPQSGRFVYKLKLDFRKPLPPPGSDPEGIEVCFKLGVISDAGGFTDTVTSKRFSGFTERSVKVLYTPKSPVITGVDREMPIEAGRQIYFAYHIEAKGVGELETKTSDLNLLPGATHDCTPVRENVKNHLRCVFQWTVPDDVSTANRPFSFRTSATHTVIRSGGKKKSSPEVSQAVRFKVVSKTQTPSARRSRP